MKINAGCGNKVLPGWTNVDIAPVNDQVERCDLLAMIFGDDSADTIMAIHVIEHFFRWEVPVVLGEFYRVLAKGGFLILEQPDIGKCCCNLLDGESDQMSMWGIYGEHQRASHPVAQLAQVHKWGWTFETLSPLVEAAGFRDVVPRETQYHGAGRVNRDFRLEARK